MKEYKYPVQDKKVKLKQKYLGSNIYIDFKMNLIVIAGRPYDSIDNILKDEYIDHKLKKEISILNNLFVKNKDQAELIMTSDMVGQKVE